MSRNDELFVRAQQSIPAGVNSPVRAFRSVGGTPRFFTRGEGAYLWDADGRRYVDYVGSWGPAIAGHAHPTVIDAVTAAAAHGLSFGAPTELEITLAETLIRRVPGIELVRLVSSGTEATMTALRLARGYTSRPKIIISSSLGQPAMMNCVTPIRLYSRNAAARSSGEPTSVIADEP